MTESEKPLITFALFAYNQERFIGEAVEAALAQDYENLEIILSDDCSSDRTFELVEAMAWSYAGPHKIILNRNDQNLGIAAHLNAIMKMVHADFVVIAAGDDISKANRTSVLANAWLSSNRTTLSLHTSAEEIDIHGQLSGRLRRGSGDEELSDLVAHSSRNVGVLGATHGWDMRLIRCFPPISSSVVNEDVILPARAALMGYVHFIDRPMVKYRAGVGVSHDVLKRRASGKYDLDLPLMKRPYYSVLQKYSDFRHSGLHDEFKSYFDSQRATILFPIWLRRNRYSFHQLYFFFKRCDVRYLLWELAKYLFPNLVSVKQRVQFGIVGKLSSIKFKKRNSL